MKTQLISVIIPIYNRESIVKPTLEAILNQTYKDWECVIVDDGSTDETEKIILDYCSKDKRIQFFKRPKHLKKGANSCRNYGFTVAKGEYINWFDSDDIMKPEFIETKVRSFNPEYDAVVHRNNYANYQLTAFRDSKFEYENQKSMFYNYAMELIELQTCCFMWRRSFLKGKMLFDENIMRYQDNEFHIRMLALKPKLKIIDTVLATIRSGDGHESQISAKINITKKKLYDVFYYRYQCLKLAKDHILDADANFNKTIAKKALWAFYAGIKFEKSMVKRLKDYIKHYLKLQYVYASPQLNLIDALKSQLYILKIILFR
ncbi:glycosyltransferase family 2 protein [Hyunsoonleella flava]|uniref:Glycosyltransferase family 2 protein n=1 Tax=Hyunsoonleella flava TaxID=2527939 RepID=A0A4Q9FCT5_9FLAO|nr:glycosyltransferase family 2 protein [Hyunsoonleella flava]TBN03593.1 glycosyltransferase family 2 protein [Hyunsoonleella flava]